MLNAVSMMDLKKEKEETIKKFIILKVQKHPMI